MQADAQHAWSPSHPALHLSEHVSVYGTQAAKQPGLALALRPPNTTRHKTKRPTRRHNGFLTHYLLHLRYINAPCLKARCWRGQKTSHVSAPEASAQGSTQSRCSVGHRRVRPASRRIRASRTVGRRSTPRSIGAWLSSNAPHARLGQAFPAVDSSSAVETRKICDLDGSGRCDLGDRSLLPSVQYWEA
jgi:hypothetical protein